MAEVQVLVDAMPDVGVELARRKDVDFTTSRYGDVGDDEAVVMLGHVLVDGIGEEPKVAIEEEDDEEGEESGGGELRDGAYLWLGRIKNQPDVDTHTSAQGSGERAEARGWELDILSVAS